jgi:sugar porter (SP) family MFS transporter
MKADLEASLFLTTDTTRDQAAINGAQIYFGDALNIHNTDLLGLVNGAPYLCCALACCLNYPLNKYLNRRGVIFATCLISSITCLLQAFSQTWWHLFLARFALGFGIGPKSATIPIYAAESAPETIRGALVLMWQMWTAFGIMCGYLSGVAFAKVEGNLKWRLMLGSPVSLELVQDKIYIDRLQMVLPLLVVIYIYALPESPRVLLNQARKQGPGAHDLYEKAFLALRSLRNSKVQAARDLFLMDHLLQEELGIMHEQRRFKELFTVGRCRRALTASVICMFLQQMCGVNVTVYYSSQIMTDAHWSNENALLLSAGFGIINFVFAFPAVWTIDTFGRRNLLLFTFPFMALFQFLMVVAVSLPNGNSRRALVIVGMYLFGIAYSPGEGPVPFVYSAESMPLYNRDYGMGIVTAINWLFNFIVSFSWPSMSSSQKGMGPAGAFAWYGTWCIVGWWLVLLFVPETKDLTLEELDQVFHKSTHEYVRHGLAQLRWFTGYYILRKKWMARERPVFLRPVQPKRRHDPRGDFGDISHEMMQLST